MPVPTEDRNPKFKNAPDDRKIKAGADPESLDKQTIAWHFHALDREHKDWGWDKLKAHQWKDILRHLISFEGMTWAALKQQAGGRRRGTNHHSLDVVGFNKTAQDRLKHLKLDDYESLFSLRINNTLRLYGIRDGRVLRLLWHDPFHGEKKGCYPTANS